MKAKRVAMIGHFGGSKTFLDGQTVKTKTFYEELSKATNWDIAKVDTYLKRKNPVKLMAQTFWALLTRRDVILLISANGMRMYFPLLSFFARVFKTRVYHSLIGANLDSHVKKNPKYVDYLNSFVVNWVEPRGLKKQLEEYGITNVEILPNFKKLQLIELDGDDGVLQKPYKLCTFSRVMQKKGIGDAVQVVQQVNELLNEEVYALDIYGQIDEADAQWFAQLQQSFPSYVEYKGMVPYSQSVDVLKNYFALLFPTHFYKEGIPGTIVDGYAAGIPAISARWLNFEDVVDENVTGYGYAFDQIDEFKELLIRIAKQPELVQQLKQNCLVKAEEFMPDKSVRKIIDKITG